MMRFNIRKETIFIICAVAAAIASMAGVLALILNDGKPRVKIVPLVSSVEQEQSSEEVSSGPYILDIKGDWYRTGVPQEQPGTIEITEVNETSFIFHISARNLTKSGSISGEAYFDGQEKAKFKNPDTGAELLFSIPDYYSITVSHTKNDTDLGCDDTVTFDGTYRQDPPSYTDAPSGDETESAAGSSGETKSSAETKNTALSKNLRNDKKVLGNLKELMGNSDYSLFKSIMTDENIRQSFSQDEAAKDKDGNDIFVDSQTGAIKYYAVLPGATTEALLMCKADGTVYAAIFEIDEVRYYTNDSAYKSGAPEAIVTFAESRPAQLKYMS